MRMTVGLLLAYFVGGLLLAYFVGFVHRCPRAGGARAERPLGARRRGGPLAAQLLTGGAPVVLSDPLLIETRAHLYWRRDVASSRLPAASFPPWPELDEATRQAYRARARAWLEEHGGEREGA